jgi:hypothetical protein
MSQTVQPDSTIAAQVVANAEKTGDPTAVQDTGDGIDVTGQKISDVANQVTIQN